MNHALLRGRGPTGFDPLRGVLTVGPLLPNAASSTAFPHVLPNGCLAVLQNSLRAVALLASAKLASHWWVGQGSNLRPSD